MKTDFFRGAPQRTFLNVPCRKRTVCGYRRNWQSSRAIVKSSHRYSDNQSGRIMFYWLWIRVGRNFRVTFERNSATLLGFGNRRRENDGKMSRTGHICTAYSTSLSQLSVTLLFVFGNKRPKPPFKDNFVF